MPVTKGPRPTPKPRPKPKKPPTPAARKGGPKKENVGAGRSAYFSGGAGLKKSTGKKMSKSERLKYQKDGIPRRILGKPYEGKVRKRPGFSHGGEMKVLKPN
jgi:hypothetical protein